MTRYHCWQCSRSNIEASPERLACPNCGSEFLEEIPAEQLPSNAGFSNFFSPNDGNGQAFPGGMFSNLQFMGDPQATEGNDAQQQSPNAARQQRSGPISTLLSSLFGGMTAEPPQPSTQDRPRPQIPTGLGQSSGHFVSFSSTIDAQGQRRNVVRTSRSPAPPSPAAANPNAPSPATNDSDDPPETPLPSSRPANRNIPVRSLSDFLSNAFGGSPQTPTGPPQTPLQEPQSPQEPPNLAQTLLNMLGGMASAQRGGAQTEDGRPAQMNGGRIITGPGFQIFFGSGMENGGVGAGFPGQFGDFVFSQGALDNVLSMLMNSADASQGPRPAPEEMINELPRKKFTAESLADAKSSEKDSECTICQDEFLVEDEPLELPCHHLFHESCIKPWLTRSGTCPSCRFQLVEQPEPQTIGVAPPIQEQARPPRAPAQTVSEDLD